MVRVLPIALAFALFLVAVIAMANTGHLGPLQEVYSFRHGDKAGHFLMLGVFTLLVDLALFQLVPRKRPFALVLLAGTAIAALIGLEELSQLWLPRRNSDVYDLLASYAGIATASLVALSLRGMVTKQARRRTA